MGINESTVGGSGTLAVYVSSRYSCSVSLFMPLVTVFLSVESATGAGKHHLKWETPRKLFLGLIISQLRPDFSESSFCLLAAYPGLAGSACPS